MEIKSECHRLFRYSFIVLLAIASCKKPATELPAADFSKAKRPHGNPLPGQISVSQTISSAGGTVKSADGIVELVVPPGAIQGNVDFVIQPIENTLEGSSGMAYRLLPENVNFSQPVEIKFSYQNLDVQPGSSEGLKIAYQDSQGYYRVPEAATVDDNKKIISVKTRHFSDWTIFEPYRLSGPSSVAPGSLAVLKLHSYIVLEPLTQGDELILGEYIELEDDMVLSSAKWSINGEGKLSPFEKGCTYHSPASPPAKNPVLITATLSVKAFGGKNSGVQKLLLLKSISIVEDEQFTFKLGGSTERLENLSFIVSNGSLNIFGRMKDGSGIRLAVNALKTGSFSFGSLSDADKADLSLVDGNGQVNDILFSYRLSCDPKADPYIFSNGHVNISAFPKRAGEFLQGDILGATLYRAGDLCNAQGGKSVSASFKLMLRN